MKGLRWFVLGAALGVAGCGESSITPPTPNKTVPELPFLHAGRTLEDWKALDPKADAELRIQQAYALAEKQRETTMGILFDWTTLEQRDADNS